MKVTRFNDAETYEPEKDWKRISLCNEKDISVEHFVKPAGHRSPHHHHPNSQVLFVLKGKLEIQTDNHGTHLLEEGDTAYIPGDEPHVVINPMEKPSIGLDIFIPGRSFDFWLKKKQAT